VLYFNLQHYYYSCVTKHITKYKGQLETEGHATKKKFNITEVHLLEAAEMRFFRSIKGYIRLDKITYEVIRKELEISGIQET
jgi:hypothetical protein